MIGSHRARCALAAGVMVAAIGCASSPPVRYYSLSPLLDGGPSVSAVVDAQGVEPPLVIGVGPLKLPDYLNRSQIVSRRDGGELVIDDFSRWAEPLQDSVHRVIAANLDAALTDAVAISYPFFGNNDLPYRVVGQIDRFDLDGEGVATLAVQWSIVVRGASTVPRRTVYRALSDDRADARANAQALSEALAAFSREVARRAGREVALGRDAQLLQPGREPLKIPTINAIAKGLPDRP